MEYRVLGEVEVVGDDGVELPVRGVKQRALLLTLLIRANETVPADRLADELWGEDVPSGGANALQAQVSTLRRALGPAGSSIVTGQGGYRLEVQDDQVDAHRFEALATEGRAALAEGRTAAAAERLDAALRLWRGPALDGSADDGQLRREADRLDELRWSAREDLLDAQLQEGRDAELVPELQALVAEAPLRERLHGFLMLALYRSGRQADALRAFHDARTLLGEELGLDPGPELVALEAAILAQDPSLIVDRPATTTSRRTNLTPTLSSFIGREDDLATLRGLVDEHRLVTVVGPGGAGKTRLAHEAGLAFREDADVWMVELAAITDPAAVDAALVTTIGSNAAPGEGSALDLLVDHLRPRPTLLVLDNCEHVIGTAAGIAEHLLRACPDLRVLATSREALGIGGETLWAVPPLSAGDAQQLFAERAEAVGGLVPDGDGHTAVADLCARLDGMPLAIELAAARSRSLPVEQLASRLDDRFRLLTGGARTALPRQQTLRAVVEWSYDLLFTDEQEVFNRFSVFAGGCSLDAAEAVCSGGTVEAEDVADVLARLVDKSLVVVERRDGNARYDQLQTLALYGRERLAATDDASATRDRHAAHYRNLGLSGGAALRGTGQRAWLASALREVPNVRVALAWFVEHGDAQSAHELAGGIGRAFWHTGGREEGVRLFDTALACPGEVTTEARATTLMWAAAVRSTTGTGIDEAIAMAEEAFALWATTGDDLATAEGGTLLGGVYVVAGALDNATATFDRVAALLEGRDDSWARALATSAAGRAAINRGDLATAEDLLEESVENFVASGAQWAAATGWSDLGIMANMRGDHEAFARYTERALVAAREMSMGLAVSQLQSRLGNLAVAEGDEERAEALFADALAEADKARSDMSTAYARLSRCALRRDQGRIPEAREDVEAALVTFREAGAAVYEAHGMAYLGFIAETKGELDEARRLHRLGLERVRATDDLRTLALTLDGLAGVAMAEGDAERSAELLGRSRRLRLDAGGTPIYPRSDHDRIFAAVEAMLDEPTFTAALARGEAADTDELV